MDTEAANALFKPFEHKSLKLRNRIVMSPMTRYFAPDGTPMHSVKPYYDRRATGGVGLIITEGVFPDRGHSRNNEHVPWFHGDRLLPWRDIVKSVHTAGAAIAPQLWHVGGLGDFKFPASPMNEQLESPSGLFTPDRAGGAIMTEQDVSDVVASFSRAARDAKALGFDSLELHGGHGYLFDQFFWDGTNKRTDRYGGMTIGDRTRFAVDVIRGVRAEVGEDFVLFFRMSQWKVTAYEARIARSPAELEEWVGPLADAGVDIFDCSQRRFWEAEFDGSPLNLAGWVKKLSGRPTMTVGSVGLDADIITGRKIQITDTNIPTIEDVATRLDRGEFDLVAVGRALIADADWANKVREGQFSDIAKYSERDLKDLY